MKPIITVSNISKIYKIGKREPYYSLRDNISSFFSSKKTIDKNIEDHFLALNNVSFEVQKGESLGIIGKNGSGKSTLLKILSRITPPTSGIAVISGKVSCLLEVGTGFSPELTGRENIYLNGAILGMKQSEIKRKFDEIVDFSGVEQFIDTPVKRYSSGMYMRLAFSVAAHLNTEILIIDEVLAVGDAEFQQKCLGKMNEVTKEFGKTILFVSHNMGAVSQLCSRCLLLNSGRVVEYGEVKNVISLYLNNKVYNGNLNFALDKNKPAQIRKITFTTETGNVGNQIPMDCDFFINIYFDVRKKITKATICLEFFNRGEMILLSTESETYGGLRDYQVGKYASSIRIPKYLFNSGQIYINVSLQKPGYEYLDHVKSLSLDILNSRNLKTKIFGGDIPGITAQILEYKTVKL